MVVEDLGWVDLDFESSKARGPLLSLLTAPAGWWSMSYQDMPTQVRHHYGHPVPFSNVAGMAPVGAHLGAQTLDGTNFSISKDNDKVTAARVPIGNRTNPFA